MEKEVRKGKKAVSEKALRDFEIYAKGVERLEELRKELNSMDTRQFRKEEREIRSKLNKVHLIPQIEHEMRELRAKISEIDLSYEKEKVDKRQSQEIRALEKKEEFAEKVPSILSKLGAIKGRVGYLTDNLEKESKDLEKIKPKVTEALREAAKNHLSSEQIGKLEKISRIQEKVRYLRNVLGRKSEKLARFEQDMVNSIEKLKQNQITRKERKEIAEIPRIEQKLPEFGNKINLLRQILSRKLKRDKYKQHEIDKELSEEAESIIRIRQRLSLLKKELEKKTENLEGELRRKLKMPAKKKILEQIDFLNEKINRDKEELYKKLTETLADARWSVEKEKQDLRQELGDIVAESRWLIEKESNELNKNLLDKFDELNKKAEKDKQEIYNKFQSKLINLRAELNSLLKEREEQKLREKIEMQNKSQHSAFAGRLDAELEMHSNNAARIPNRFPQPFIVELEEDKPEVKKLKILRQTEADIIRQIKEQTARLKSKNAIFSESIKAAPFSEYFDKRNLLIDKDSEKYDYDEDDSPLPELSIKNIPEGKEVFANIFPRPVQFPKLPQQPEITKIYQAHIPQPISVSSSLEEKKIMAPSSVQQAKPEIKKEPERIVQMPARFVQKQNKPKKRLFLEMGEFKDTEINIESIKLSTGELEKRAKSSLIHKGKSQYELRELIRETEEINRVLASINESILNKIKEV